MGDDLPGVEYWDSDDALRDYTKPPELMGGERLALKDVFANDLSGKKVLDLGCGGGRTSVILRDMGGEVIGVDISTRLIGAARRRFPDIDFQLGDAVNLTYPDASFDCVLFSFNGLDYLYPLKARLKGIGEIWRVLRPGGVFILSFHNLSSFMFGWYQFMRPWKLAFRAKHILLGNFFKPECFLLEPDNFGMWGYHAWPHKFREGMEANQFEVIGVYPNDPVLGWLQQTIRSTVMTRLCDPWPYYAFRKTVVK
ncbi:MAG: hypothetical protein NPIRA03_09890 [Nitrospirales bacterium]|nr:MAG: hypothetical protein NPIRA03_09890 [Nitrospirales bacterium]